MWAGGGPDITQDDGQAQVPAKPAGLSVETEQGSLDVSLDWDDVDGVTFYWVRWRLSGPGHDLNDGVRPTSSTATITVADYGTWVVRVQACNRWVAAGRRPNRSQ